MDEGKSSKEEGKKEELHESGMLAAFWKLLVPSCHRPSKTMARQGVQGGAVQGGGMWAIPAEESHGGGALGRAEHCAGYVLQGYLD